MNPQPMDQRNIRDASGELSDLKIRMKGGKTHEGTQNEPNQRSWQEDHF